MIFKLVVLLFLLVIIDAGEGFRTDCKFHNYSGGPGEVIAKFEPTLPGNVSLEFGSKAFGIISKLVGGIPEAGKALSILFGVVGAATDTTVDKLAALQKAINDLIADVKKTVVDLKKYVDAKFDEYDYDKKSEALKGLYDESTICSSFGRPDNIESCLHDLALSMVRKYPTFLPIDQKYETFEQLLPMTRQFADLHIAALTDILNIRKLDPDYKNMLANFSVNVYNYFVHGITVTVDQHLKNTSDLKYDQVDVVEIPVPLCYTPPCTWCYTIGAYTCEQAWDNGDGCQQQYPVPASAMNCMTAASFYPPECSKQLEIKRASYDSDLASNIRKYWKVDVGQTMEHWKKIGIQVGAKESSPRTYLTIQLPALDKPRDRRPCHTINTVKMRLASFLVNTFSPCRI